MKTEKITTTLRRARSRGVPIIAIETADQASTYEIITTEFEKEPVIIWDCIRCARGANNEGITVLTDLLGGDDPRIRTANLWDYFATIEPAKDSIFICFGSHMFLNNEPVKQALFNLRNAFKKSQSLLILLGYKFNLPPDLTDDIIVLSESLPDDEQLRKIVIEIIESANEAGADIKLSEKEIEKAIDCLTGLSQFSAEQQLAISLLKNGIDFDQLWQRKVKVIEQTQGLRVWKGRESFGDIKGCDAIKVHLKRILNGKKQPKAIVFIDEIEKQLSAVRSDSTGVSQDQLQVILRYMQEKEVAGMIFIGPPGTAKSAIAKSAGNEANIPTIEFDFGANKSRYVGESESMIRRSLDIIDAISRGNSLWIATCNSISALPPELRRRFSLGTYFFDMPNKEERTEIWKYYIKKYELDVNSEDLKFLANNYILTGAEIKAVCDKSYRMDVSPIEGVKTLVPMWKSAAEEINSLRSLCSGKYISANTGQIFNAYSIEETTTDNKRKMEVK